MAVTVPQNTFVDGQVVGQDDLSRLAWNVDALSQILLGKTAAQAPAGKPVAKINLSSAYSIANAVNTVVTWSQEVSDNDGMFPGGPTDHLVVQTPGWYRILCHLWWDTGSGGSERVAQIFINGTNDPLNCVASRSSVCPTSNGQSYCQTVVAYEHLTAGATIYATAYQASGNPLNLLTGNYGGTSLFAAWRAPY